MGDKSHIGDFQAMRCLLICSLLILLPNCIRAADVFKNEKVKLGKRTCTCTFTMETKGTKCTGQAKCDKKCTGNGAVEVGDYSFTLAVKKGKGKIAKCTVAVMPTVGPVEPTGSGSGPVEPTGSGSGPPPPTGSGSGEVPVPMGEGMPCSCGCNCPDGAEQCDCDCNCPMMSTSVSCASGFTRVCPMMSDVCPTDTMMMCPNGGMPPAAGRMMHGSSGSSGCQCVPDFLMALVHHAMPAATRMEATDRAKDVFKNEKVKLGKRTCTCTFTMETKGSKCAGQAKCDNKCTGNGAVEVGDYSFTLAVKKGKGKISKCTVAAMPTVGPVEPTGSGSGPAPTGSGTGPMPPTGSGSGPNPPTGTGSGSGSAGYTQAWLRGDEPYGHVHEGVRLDAGDGWVGAGDLIEAEKRDKKTQVMVRRVDNAGATVWTYLVGDSHTTLGKWAYSSGYSIVQHGAMLYVGGGIWQKQQKLMKAAVIALDAATGSVV